MRDAPALFLGLDRNDAVVRKRMANKMDFLAQSMAETVEPSEETLAKWLADHPERFAREVRYGFDQRFFAERAAAEAALAALRAGGSVEGEPISLPPSVDAIARSRTAERFGEAFLEALDEMEPGAGWSGPVASGFGWHVVRLRARDPGEVPPLADIRERVENDWRAETAARRRNEAYALLRGAYKVTIAR